MRICEGPSCGRPATYSLYCGSHYAQHRRTGRVWPLRKQINSLSDEELVKEAENKVDGRKSRKVPERPCRVEGCENIAKVVSVQLCTGHYQQDRAGKEFTPLKQFAPHQDPNAAQRRCNTCKRVLPRDEFYLRANGTPQPECKTCFRYRSRINYLNRNRRPEEAEATQVAWDAYVPSAENAEGDSPEEFKRKYKERLMNAPVPEEVVPNERVH